MVGRQGKLKTKEIYHDLKKLQQGPQPDIPWMKVFYGNLARPRDIIGNWLTCHDRLATEEILKDLGS